MNSIKFIVHNVILEIMDKRQLQIREKEILVVNTKSEHRLYQQLHTSRNINIFRRSNSSICISGTNSIMPVGKAPITRNLKKVKSVIND